MKRAITLKHEFVEYIPNHLETGTIYVSIAFCTVAHKCCCGCGNEVVTPLSPTDWKLIFDGRSISLYPSIGNWSFTCRSHYWIESNRVKWARTWSQKEINAGRAYDALAKKKDLGSASNFSAHDTVASTGEPGKINTKKTLWRRLKKYLF